MKRYICPFDEAAMDENEIPFTVDIKGATIAVSGVFECVCPICQSVLVPFEMMRANTRAIADAKRAHLGMLSGAEITRIRANVLGLSRQGASIKFGLGRNAFQKYEVEGQLQSQPTDKLLRVLAHSPSAIVALDAETSHQEVAANTVFIPIMGNAAKWNRIFHVEMMPSKSQIQATRAGFIGSWSRRLTSELGQVQACIVEKSDYKTDSIPFASDLVPLFTDKQVFMRMSKVGGC